MEWISTHVEELVGAILILFGVVSVFFPQALLPKKRLEQMKKIYFTGQLNQPRPRKEKDDGEFPLALSIFLRATGLLFALAGITILLARR